MTLLAIKDLVVRYGAIQAVRGASLAVGKGEIVALLGANGAGKSSILNACMGLGPKAGGVIELDGEPIGAERTEAIVRRGMTLTPEGRRVFAGLSVLENLEIGAAASAALRARSRESREAMFELFPKLAERRSQMAGTLSGGEQQMLAIARSLMSRPAMLLLDEPSLGLAPNIVDQIFDFITTLKARGVTVLLVEQNVELSLEIADRAYVLAGGRMAMMGTPRELRAGGGLERAYLGAA
jgi:branched-chain amino acid transport system ATP-binding protein